MSHGGNVNADITLKIVVRSLFVTCLPSRECALCHVWRSIYPPIEKERPRERERETVVEPPKRLQESDGSA